MKARIPGRQRILNPLARPTIRTMLFRCAAQVMIEVFEFGGSGDKLRRLEDAVRARLDCYEKNYGTARQILGAMVADARKMGIEYIVRPGSGEKVLVGLEHDMVYLAYMMELRVHEGIKFGQVRLDRFSDELSHRIKYYNRTFDGAPEMVIPVMQERLAAYGKTDL